MPAVRAGAFYEPIGEKSLFRFGERHRLGIFDKVPNFFEFCEQLLGDLDVTIGVRVGVQVVGERHVGESLAPDLVISGGDDLWRDALFGRFKCGRCAMHVRAGDHCHFVTDYSVKSGEDVCRDVHARYVAEVRFAVYVRPSDGDKNFAGQVRFPVRCVTDEQAMTSVDWLAGSVRRWWF